MKTRAHSDIPRGSNAHEDLGALCSLYSFFYPLVINQKAKRAAPYTTAYRTELLLTPM